ncbi:MAG: hypothetical protein ACR2QV_03900 [Gammaproteobacteria bacterium]
MIRNIGISQFLTTFSCALILTATGCAGDENSSAPAATPAAGGETAPATERGGTITVGEQTWVIVPQFCSVYPGPIANIAGHAASDPSLEIVIDFGGPDQVVVGSGRDVLWRASKETLEVQIDGQVVRGTANFNEGFAASGKSATGSFEVNCG